MTTTEPMTVARQLAMLVGEEKALTAIEAGWRAIRGINSESPQPIVHPGAADYVATAAILAAVEAGLADPTELTAERDAAQRESGDMAGELTNAWAALNRAGFQSPVDGVAELIDQMSAALTQSRQQAATYANEIGALKADLTLAVEDRNKMKAKLDGPCGSCHPCTNYADETWRAAGRKPPHVITWNDAQDELKALRPLAAAATEWRRRYGNTSEAFDTACKALVAAVDALPNPEQHFELCPGYGCPGCRDEKAEVAS